MLGPYAYSINETGSGSNSMHAGSGRLQGIRMLRDRDHGSDAAAPPAMLDAQCLQPAVPEAIGAPPAASDAALLPSTPNLRVQLSKPSSSKAAGSKGRKGRSPRGAEHAGPPQQETPNSRWALRARGGNGAGAS